jgi:phage terminase large subunit GpA-like protein
MHKLKQLMAERIAASLKRSSISTCSEWAENYRIMGAPFPGKLSFKYHPWTKEMHDTTNDIVVGQKGAQLGFTEVGLNKTFYNIDIKGNNVLYILPAATPDASDFSTSRFDPALELSPHLSKLFSDVSNIGHKRAGSANLFIRGSRSRSQLKSVPASLAIVDELEEMNQTNVALIPERMSGQLEKQLFYLSTPTIPKFGINRHYLDSSEDHYTFKCPSCSRWTELIFPDCLVLTAEDYLDTKIQESHLKCKDCGNMLPHQTKPDWLGLDNAAWTATRQGRLSRGFHISQLYSMTVKPYEVAVSYLKAQINPTDEQEFYNSKLGLPHEVEGASCIMR